MNNELKYRVKYGFTSSDQVSIDVEELEKALYMQKYAVVGFIGGKQINGKYIIEISKDYHHYTGWYRSYEPKSGEDFAQIERDCPKGMELVLENYKKKIDFLINSNQKHLIGKNIVIPELENGDEVKKLN
jgi:hypothetical protein